MGPGFAKATVYMVMNNFLLQDKLIVRRGYNEEVVGRAIIPYQEGGASTLLACDNCLNPIRQFINVHFSEKSKWSLTILFTVIHVEEHT